MLEAEANTCITGRQDICANLADLKYGVSVTDGCIDFAETLTVLENLASAVRLGWARKDLDAQMVKNTVPLDPIEKVVPSVQIVETEVSEVLV